MHKIIERTAYTIYVIVIILSILLFGAMHTYAYTLMTIGVLIASILVLINNIRENYKTGRYQVRLPNSSLNLGMVLLLIFLAFQITPLPESMLEVLSPQATVVGRKSLPASAMVGMGPVEPVWFPLAPYYYPVRMSFIRLTIYGLFFLGLIQVLSSKKRIDLLVWVILITGCFNAIYGLIQTYSGFEHIWWFKKHVYKGDVCGTYINRNHFAGFMEMGILLAVAFAAGLAPRKKESSTSLKRKASLPSRILDILSRQEEFTKRILIVFSGVVLGIGLIFSASRGGMIAAAGAMFLMGLLYVLRKGFRRNGLIILSLFLTTAVYAFNIGVEYPIDRFKSFYSTYEARTRYADKTIEMFEDYPIFGLGIGNFKYAYPKYQAPEDNLFIRFAHNDWAQFLAEAGVIGMGLLVGCVGYYLFKTINLWRRRNDPFAVCLGIVPVGAMTAIGIHSYSDFNLHIPANVLVLAAVMAIGHAALHLERHRRRDRMNYTYYDLPLKYRGGVVLVLIFGLIGWSGCWSIRHFAAEGYCNTVPNSTLNRDPDPLVEEIAKAIVWDEANAEYWYKLGEKLETESSKVTAQNSELNARSLKRGKDGVGVLERAVRLNPFEALYHLRLGWAYAHRWEEKDYHSKWLPAADISMARAAYFAGVKNPRLYMEMGNYWIMRSKSVYPNDSLYHEAWVKACQHYQEALRIEAIGLSAGSRKIEKEIREYVWNFYPDKEMVDECLAQGL